MCIMIGGWEMNSRDLERILKADGWRAVSQTGSHRHFKHPFKSGKVTVPQHKGDIPVSTVKSILKQAGI